MLAEDDEAPLTLQPVGKDDFLGDVELLVKAAGIEPGLAGAEQEAAGGEAKNPENRWQEELQNVGIEGQATFVEANGSPTADGTLAEGGDGGSQRWLGDGRVGV